VSIAVFDVLNAINGTSAYMVDLDAPDGICATAAVAAAAYRILNHAFPAQGATLDAELAGTLAEVEAGAGRTAAVTFGNAVADAVIAVRAQDGWDTVATYDGGTEPGEWRPTEPGYQPALAPQWGSLTPFALASGDQFRPKGPPDLTDVEYAAALEEVERLGSATSAERTTEQTEIARFWADGSGSYTPPGHWNQIATEIADLEGSSAAENARMLATLNVALADASVATWDAKYTYGFWRPITAIRLADTDGNELTTADPDWSPLLTTPNHPEYVSGHAAFSGAAAEVLTDFFGDRAFSATSVSLPGVTRDFDSFADAAVEAGRSRVFGGIHYQFSNQDGLAMGDAVADWVLDTFRTDHDDRIGDGKAPCALYVGGATEATVSRGDDAIVVTRAGGHTTLTGFDEAGAEGGDDVMFQGPSVTTPVTVTEHDGYTTLAWDGGELTVDAVGLVPRQDWFFA
jgi:hypothetical protein